LVSSHYSVSSGAGALSKILTLSAVIISGVFSYIIFCFIFKVSEMRELWRWLVSRRKA